MLTIYADASSGRGRKHHTYIYNKFHAKMFNLKLLNNSSSKLTELGYEISDLICAIMYFAIISPPSSDGCSPSGIKVSLSDCKNGVNPH